MRVATDYFMYSTDLEYALYAVRRCWWDLIIEINFCSQHVVYLKSVRHQRYLEYHPVLPMTVYDNFAGFSISFSQKTAVWGEGVSIHQKWHLSFGTAGYSFSV